MITSETGHDRTVIDWIGGRNMEYYQKRIRDLREDADKTQSEIAEMLGTSQTMYARYERGASELPIRHLIKLARYYHVSTDDILGLMPRP